jgi:Sec-independent protein secretion pathway component TatC
MAVPMVILYEVGILLSRILLREREAQRRSEEQSASS